MKIDSIKQKLSQEFSPTLLEVFNDSGLHNVPKGSETHFRVFLVSQAFEGKSRLERNRMVYSLLDEELKTGVHALSIKALSPKEFSDNGDLAQKPTPCAHKGESKNG